MSGTNEGNGLKIAMIISIMLSIGFMVAFYLVFKDVEKFKEEARAAKQQSSEADGAFVKAQNEIDFLKKKIGHELDQVGVGTDDADKTHVLGAMNDDIKTYGGEFAQITYSATIVELRNQLNTIISERDKQKAELDKLNSTLLATEGQYAQKVSANQKNRNEAQADLQSRIGEFETQVSERDGNISRMKRELTDVQLELQKQQELYTLLDRTKNEEVKQLININDRLREDIDNIRKVSFEKPDGVVRWVDNSTGLAWVSLGSDDNIPRQVTFSIYGKNHQGVGRQELGIKGALEITRILGPHLSEARITRLASLDDPIAPEDVIYSPLWQKGRIEYFSLVGTLDLDNDGLSDRALIHDIIASTGAKIDNEVDDAGNLTGNGITVNTKFLVMGSIPDPTGLPPDSAELDRVNQIIQHRTDMVNQARVQAVRVINLNDFLTYIGYVPKQRLFVPGQAGNQFNLRAGQIAPGVNAPPFRSEAAGSVSGLYKNQDN